MGPPFLSLPLLSFWDLQGHHCRLGLEVLVETQHSIPIGKRAKNKRTEGKVVMEAGRRVAPSFCPNERAFYPVAGKTIDQTGPLVL